MSKLSPATLKRYRLTPEQQARVAAWLAAQGLDTLNVCAGLDLGPALSLNVDLLVVPISLVDQLAPCRRSLLC